MQACVESLPAGQPIGRVSLLSLDTRGETFKGHGGMGGSLPFSAVSEPLSLLFLQVAAKALETGVFGAYFNVLINLKDVTDDVFKEKVGRHDARLHPGTFHVYCGQG